MRVRDLGGDCPPEGSEQRIGVEIEIENCRDYPFDTGHWRIEEDGSLRNRGREFVTRGGKQLGDLMPAIDQFYEWFEMYEYTASARTGIHVHLDMSDNTMEELDSVLTTYCLVEPILMHYCGAEREQNIYCVPWYRSEDEAKQYREARGLRRLRMRSALSQNTCKYSALYLEPLTRFGTIEFRHAPTFQQPEQLRDWVSLCLRTKLYGVGRTPEQVLTRFNELGADAWLVEVFGQRLLDHATVDLCESASDLIHRFDAESVAEIASCIPCTYNETWERADYGEPAEERVQESIYNNRTRPGIRVPAPDIDFETVFDRLEQRGQMNIPMPIVEDEGYDEEYDEDEEY